MARIPYPTQDVLSERTREVLERMPALNIFRMLAHADSALVPFMRLSSSLWSEAELSPKPRELAILAVARATGAEYEWTQHKAVAAYAGVSGEQIAAIESGELDSPLFDPAEQAVLALARSIVIEPRSSEAVFDAAREHYSDRQIVAIHLVAGTYFMLARVMTNLEVDMDEPVGEALVDGAERAERRRAESGTS
jgi:AhpD family alkylhydroperoxidase